MSDLPNCDLASVSPRYRALKEKLQQIRQRESELTEDAKRDIAEYRRLVPRRDPERRRQMSADARAMLSDIEIAPDPAPSAAAEFEARIRQRERDLRALKEAAEVLEEDLRPARAAASAAMRERIRPEYVRRARRLCEALVAVAQAKTAVEQLTDELNLNEVQWSMFGVLGAQWLTSMMYPHGGGLNEFLREAIEHDLASEALWNQLPKSLTTGLVRRR